tara:strand:+ start:181 stop:477 length:297 start_codon:yes stop_codon:yes gene_type:complete
MRRYGPFREVETLRQRLYDRGHWVLGGRDKIRLFVGKIGKKRTKGMQVTRRNDKKGYDVKIGNVAFWKNTGEPEEVRREGKKKKSSEPSNPFRIGRNY